MSVGTMILRQVRWENRSFWRNPAAAFFTFVFPLMFLVIFTLVFGNEEMEYFGRKTTSVSFYVPAIAAFSVITACYTNLAMSIAFSRDQGVLKRKRGTPLPAAAFLLGRVIHSTLMAVLLVAIVAAFGAAFYDVAVPTRTLPAFLVTLVVGAAAFCSLGLAVTSVIPNADAAPAVVNGSILPLLFISDVFFPDTQAPEWLRTLASLFPIKHYSEAMQHAFHAPTGAGFRWFDIAVVTAWGVAGLLYAARSFSWEPRR